MRIIVKRQGASEAYSVIEVATSVVLKVVPNETKATDHLKTVNAFSDAQFLKWKRLIGYARFKG